MNLLALPPLFSQIEPEMMEFTMSKPYLLAIGDFYDWDREAMEQEFTLLPLEDGMAVSDIDPAIRKATRYAARIFHRDVGRDVFDAFPNLEIVANYGVGYDGIDADEAADRGIAVTNTPDVLTADVADQTILLLLTYLRDSNRAEAYMREGRWPSGGYPLKRSLGAGRAGIIGLGRIGTAIAKRLEACECEIAYFARSQKPSPKSWTHFDTLVGLAEDVDYLINVLPGGPETDDLINREVFEALGPSGVFVNVGRGSSVDEEALFAALGDGTIHGAALDVFKNEPNIDARFFDFENVVLQPHAASATVETRKAMGQLMRDNLTAAHQGKALLTRVN